MILTFRTAKGERTFSTLELFGMTDKEWERLSVVQRRELIKKIERTL